MQESKIHGYKRGNRWHPAQLVGSTACGREAGRVLGVQVGVRVTSDDRKVTCKACKRALGSER